MNARFYKKVRLGACRIAYTCTKVCAEVMPALTGEIAQMNFDTNFESRLAAVDLTKVMQHVVDDHGLNAADAARAEDLYRKFLTLVHENPGVSLVPPRLVDLVWHAHITFTRQYMADCEALFGRYLHHNPSEADLTEDYVAGTVAQLASRFNDVLDVRDSRFAAGACGS
jgi:hypothetical protein